jgi:hypothetical protein
MSTIVASSAMKPQVLPPLSTGATSPMASAQIAQQQQIAGQMALIGKSGGSKKRLKGAKKISGGATQIQVPSVQPGAVNSQQTADSYKALTQLAEQQASQSVYDNKVKMGGYRRRYRITKRKRGSSIRGSSIRGSSIRGSSIRGSSIRDSRRRRSRKNRSRRN